MIISPRAISKLYTHFDIHILVSVVSCFVRLPWQGFSDASVAKHVGNSPNIKWRRRHQRSHGAYNVISMENCLIIDLFGVRNNVSASMLLIIWLVVCLFVCFVLMYCMKTSVKCLDDQNYYKSWVGKLTETKNL